MFVRYIIFALIPVFFALGACNKQTIQTDGFFDFSAGKEIEDETTDLDDDFDDFFDDNDAEKPSIAKVEIKKDKTKDAVSEQKTEEKDTYTSTTENSKPLKRPAIEGDEKFIKTFNIGYLAFDVADVYAELKPVKAEEDHTTYRLRFYSKSNGFIDYLFGWMSHTVTTMNVYEDRIVPEKYMTKVVLKKKTREIALDYDNNGKITFEEVIPPDNRGKRPAVDDKLKPGTYDPLTAVIEARRRIMKAFKDNSFNGKGQYSFSIPMYDGRRRSDLNFLANKKKVQGNYHIKVTQKPVAGYTNNEMKEINKGERVMDFYVEPVGFWPVEATGKSPLGQARAKYTGDCDKKFEDCIRRKQKRSEKSKNR